MKPDQSTIIARQLGSLPDRYWYQLNGKSAQENYTEQKTRNHEELTEQYDDEDGEIFITSEVKIK